ncbi:MAG: hypothetical protein A2138_05825 [Deltaproteobacteria bacterium RBG_16_71_12]|nr:MAG: hypothetical protein A2138_05825 [Deltaproteobacteria bacterium RBG_16_71_12]
MSALLLAVCLTAAPEAPAAPVITSLAIEGDVRVDLVVGVGRGVEVLGGGVDVVGPADGRVRVTAPLRASGARPTVRVQVAGPTLEVTVQRGAQLRDSAGRLESLTIEARHTSRVDVAALAVRSLVVTASEAARVRARGEQVTLRAQRTAQVTLAGKPKKLAQDVRDAARLTIE